MLFGGLLQVEWVHTLHAQLASLSHAVTAERESGCPARSTPRREWLRQRRAGMHEPQRQQPHQRSGNVLGDACKERTLREVHDVGLAVAARAQHEALAPGQRRALQPRAHLHVPALRVHLACARTDTRCCASQGPGKTSCGSAHDMQRLLVAVFANPFHDEGPACMFCRKLQQHALHTEP